MKVVTIAMTLCLIGGTLGAEQPIPVIFNTDIGGDIDDTWALAYLLRSPELDLKLLVTDFGDTVYRAKVAARLLEVGGRADVPIGIGIRQSEDGGPQQEWVADYSLDSYPGTIHDDGVQAMIDMIRAAPDTITLIAVGPAPNLKEALSRAPDIAEKVRFVGMYGSVRVGYNGSPKPEPEWNVRADVASVRAIFAAPWEMTLTPLDTCGTVALSGQHYATVRESENPLARAVIENYRLWLPHIDWLPEDTDPDLASTVLFDIVAVYLAFAEEFVEIEEIGLRVTDEGMTVEEPTARQARTAVRWRDREALESQIVERLTGSSADDSCRISLAQWSLHRELFSGAIDNLDFPKVAAEKFGIHHIEWVSQFFQDKAEDRGYLQRMKDRCDEHGVQSLLIMIDGEGNLGSSEPTERKQAVENHRKWIDAAAFLGAHAIRVNGNGLGEPEEVKRALVMSLQELSDIAAEKGVNVLVENHGMALKDGTWTPDVPSTNGAWLADVLATVDRPNVGALPDFGNFYSYDRYQGLEDLLPYARGVSAKTNEFDTRGEDTRTDFGRMFDLIQTHGFDGYIGVEYEGPDDSGLTEYQGIQKSIDLIERYCE